MGDTADLDVPIAELYGGPLTSFVAQRDALARTLRSAGRRDEAGRVKALKKPKAVAWALDAGGHADPDSMSELASAIDGVTEAQSGGGDVRAAIARLRAAESALVTAAGDATSRHDQPVDATALAAALRAVVGDPDAMAALVVGRLVDVPGVGGVRPTSPRGPTSPEVAPPPDRRRPTKVKAPAPAPADRERPAPPRDTSSIAAARRAVAAAERAAKTAATTARRASAAADAADKAVEEAEARAATARRRADQALDAARRARSEADAAAAARDDADSEVATTQGALRALQR
jgi:hypothetical protein